ncbi:mannosyl-3-phosphoglycerate phosphatase-related protein, partial [Salmonella enterica subsp. enterica serovar Heidelberg]
MCFRTFPGNKPAVATENEEKMLSIHDPLLFTDLDGTLLNSHTFEWQP